MSTITREFTKEQLSDDRLVKILSETQAVVTEHNSRCVRGSVEVDARLFESMLVEIQLRRHLMEQQAAMLQGADGNSPIISDGWVACSERMPEREIDVQVYCSDKKEQMVGYMERNERDGYFRFASLPNGGGVYCQPTHWMPMPAAPQQEVKP